MLVSHMQTLCSTCVTNLIFLAAEYRIIADYAPIGIARASATGEIYFVNEEWFNMSQYEPRELPIKNWAPYIEPADLETLSTTWFGFLQSTDPDFKTCKFEWGWSRTGRRVSAVFARLDKVQPGSGLTGVIGCLVSVFSCLPRSPADPVSDVSDRYYTVSRGTHVLMRQC